MSLHTATGIGHALAKLLGIKINYRNPTCESVTRGESTFSASTADIYVEQEPIAWDWLEDLFPSGRQLLQYVYNLFPFVHWIGRYNLQWLSGDLVAGRLVFHLTKSEDDNTSLQASHSALSWFPNQWLMLSWLCLNRSSVFTRLSWVSSFIGSSPRPRTSPLG